jgi:prophage regulatory protein
MRILRIPEVLARTGLSRTSLYAKIAAGEFPRQVALGPRASGWREADVDRWIESLANKQPPRAA